MNRDAVLVPLPGFEPLAASVTGMDIVRPICTRFRNREIAVRLHGQVADRDRVLMGTAAPPAERLIELGRWAPLGSARSPRSTFTARPHESSSACRSRRSRRGGSSRAHLPTRFPRTPSWSLPIAVRLHARARRPTHSGARGAENVLISRAERPALASVGGDLLELSGPRFEPLDHHGAGDSMVAAVAVGVARGLDLHTVLRMAVAAGALNVTRRGLGSGERGDIERMAGAVRLRPVVAQAR